MSWVVSVGTLHFFPRMVNREYLLPYPLKQIHVLCRHIVCTKYVIKTCCSVTKLCPTLQCHGLQHAMLLCPSLSPGVCLNSHPLNQWCYLTISSSAALFSFCLQSFQTSESALHIRWARYWSFGFSISPSNEYSGLISLYHWLVWSPCSPRDSQEYNTTVQRHQFFGAQLTLWSNSQIHTWLLEKPYFDYVDHCQ